MITATRLRRIVCGFLVAVLAVTDLGAPSAMALTDGQRQKFSQNNILFFNPDGDNCRTTFNLGNIEATGEFNENAVFIMAYLISQGFSAEAAAGIVGNLKGESGSFNPGEGENGYSDDITDPNWRLTTSWACYNRCGFGIAQWTSGSRQLALQAYADEKGMPVLSLELQTLFLIKELNERGLSSSVMNSKTLEEATFVIFHDYESPRAAFQVGEYNGRYYNDYNPTSLDMLDQSRTPAAYNAYMTRLGYAYGALEVISQNNLASVSATTGGASGNAAADGSNVTIIGDSITERSRAAILAKLPNAEIYSQVSKQFYTGTSDNPGGYTILSDLVDAGNLRKVLVYALGTNGNFTLNQAKDVVNKAGNDTKIIFVNNYAVAGSGYDFTANNNVLAQVASNYSNVTVANWESVASRDPALYMEDAVHPTMGEGTDLFAKTIADAVGRVTGGSGGGFNTCGSDRTNYDYNVEFQIVDGVEYVFPLAGATKANYLNPGGSAGSSVLSRLPCGSGNLCHHDYAAVDLGLRKKMIDGTEYTSADFPGYAFSEMYYYSTGVKVLAFVGGKITSYSTYSNRVPADYVSKCASVTYRGNDGKTYWLGHMSYDATKKAGDTFEAGEIIGEIGPPQCAQSTQAHLHINISPQSANDRYIIDLMDILYEGLPAN